MHLLVEFKLLFVSCQELIDRQLQNQANENYTSPFQGKWVGNYSGNMMGTLILNVKKSGTIEVTRTDSNNNTETYHTEVYDNGALYNTPSINSGFTLYGNFNTITGNNASGTWKMGSSTGNWSITKQ